MSGAVVVDVVTVLLSDGVVVVDTCCVAFGVGAEVVVVAGVDDVETVGVVVGGVVVDGTGTACSVDGTIDVSDGRVAAELVAAVARIA